MALCSLHLVLLVCLFGLFTHVWSAHYYQAPLPYAFNALEPHLDEENLRVHYLKHHEFYVSRLNLALRPIQKVLPLEELLQQKNIDALPEDIRTTVLNYGGGHFNHQFFWSIMMPANSTTTLPKNALLDAIQQEFGSLKDFKRLFSRVAGTVFGSGWAWLYLDHQTGKLVINSTSNQFSPVNQGNSPILALDVWEHAYYLKYRNLRVDYITNWFSVVNWDAANAYYLRAIEPKNLKAEL